MKHQRGWTGFFSPTRLLVHKDLLLEFLYDKILAIGSKAKKELQPSTGEIVIAHKATDTNVAIKLDKPLTTRRPEELMYNGALPLIASTGRNHDAAVMELKAMDNTFVLKEWTRVTETTSTEIAHQRFVS